MSELDSLPRVAVLATGGTIAGAADDLGSAGYSSGVLGVDELVAAVPRVAELARLEGAEIARVGSQDMSDAIWLDLAREILLRLEPASDLAGIVVTHGTDTLEETAYFLDLVVPDEVPVVVTGAMRPATGLSADGPRNLLDSVRVSIHLEAVDRGVLVVLDETIHTARGVTKTNTSHVSTFQSPELGVAGKIVAGRPVFFRPAPPRLSREARFELDGVDVLPRVDVIYAHAGVEEDLVASSIDRGARGIVLAGVGNGNAPARLLQSLAEAVRLGVPVVRSSRTSSGFVARNVEVDDDALGFVAAGDLNPAKSRVLLKLALHGGNDPRRLQDLFFAP